MGLLTDPNITLIHYLPGLEEGIESFGTGVVAHCSNQVGVGNKVKVLWISKELLTSHLSSLPNRVLFKVCEASGK